MENGKVKTFYKIGEIKVTVILGVLELWKWVLVQKTRGEMGTHLGIM